MGIKYKSTFNAQAHAKRITDRTKERLEIAMSDAKAEILVRTEKGQGVLGALKQYSATYKKFRQKKGYSTTPNLRRTGQMLKAVQSSVQQSGQKLIGRIYFLAQEQQKARWNQALRNFFGLTREQIEKIKRKLRG